MWALRVSAKPGFAVDVCTHFLLAVHPAERHTAAGADADGLCDAARCFPVAFDDATPHG